MTTRCDNEERPAALPPVVAAIVALMLGLVGSGCGGPKPIHHYEPQVLTQDIQGASTPRSDLVLAIEDFSAGSAYDEQRMVYRSADYRFDYYHFHRWAAPPGMLVSDSLREVYRETGAFRSVVGGFDSRADIILSGRVIAFEEIDREEGWFGRVVINLRVRDSRTGELLWNDTLEREKPLPEQTPHGLAAAISQGLTEIGIATTSDILDAAKQRSMKQTDTGNGGMFESSGSESAPDPSGSSEPERGGTTGSADESSESTEPVTPAE